MLRLMSSETPGRGLAFWIVGFSAFVLSAIVIHAIWFYDQQREYTIQRALTDAQNLANALEEHTRSTLQWTEFSLASLSDDIEDLLESNRGTVGDFRRAVETANRETPETASFVFAEQDGNVISESSQSQTAFVNIAQERYFQQALATHESDVYVIAPPWPADGAKTVIALVRPVHRTDGTFAGVVIGTIDPRYFGQVHTQLDLGENSTVAVFSRDGIMIARAPHREEFIGVSFADDPMFQEISRSRLHGGHYNAHHHNETARFIAYRTMPDYPLVVALGRAEDEILTPLRVNGRVTIAYVIVLVGMLSVFAAWMLILARRQERFHRHLVAVFDNVNQGVVVFDKDMRVVGFNAHHTNEMFDFPPGFIKPGIHYLDVVRFLAERGEYPGRSVDEVIASRLESAPHLKEQRIIHHRPNGKVVIIYRKPMAPDGFIITFTDITEDVRLKKEAEEQARLLSLVLNGIQQGIRVFDKDMNLVLANPRLVDTFGYPEDFVRPGANYESTVRISVALGEYGAGDPEALTQERVALGRGAINRGAIRRTPSGRYVKKQRDPIPGGGFVSTYTDVTELVRAEAELARKSDLLQLSLENMGDGISVYDENLRLINFNQRWIEVWNIPEHLAQIGTSYVDLMRRHIEKDIGGSVSDPDSFIAKRVDDLLNQRMTRDELPLPDGRTILVRRFAAPNGVIVINHTDITRLKQAEMETGRKSALLEAVLDHMSQGILVCDTNMRVVAFNEQFLTLQGYRQGDMHLGMNYTDVLRLAARRDNIQTDDLDAFIAERLKSIQAREYYRKEYQAGSGRHVTLRRTPMPDGGFVTTAADITNRKKAEMALQVSEERYRSLVISSTQLIWTTDAEGSVIEPLPTWQRFTGQSDEEVMGSGWIKALHPDDIAYVRRNWLMALETTSICNYEYRLRRHDGVYRHFSVRGVPVLNADGSVREWVGVSEDITERKKAEAEVVAKSALFEATLQHMAQGVTVFDQDLQLVAYNQRYIDLFEFPAGFITLGRPHGDTLRFLADRGDFGSNPEEQFTQRLAAARKRESYQREFLQANGRTLFVSHTAMPGGGFINTFTDISDRKQAEQALQESEERLRAILDNIADAIITTDKAGLIQSCNLAASSVFGYGPDEAIGMDIRSLIPNSNIQPRNNAAGTGGNETVARRQDGSIFPIDIAVTSVELPGRWLQIAIVRDIGQQKALQAQLFQASKLATLGEMAAAMAHEMNQPLNVMRMAADNGLIRLERKVATEEYLRQNLTLISAQAERLGKLITHMRVFSRVDPTEFEPFDPRASVAAAVELMGSQLALRNIRVTTSFPDGCNAVLGLPAQLEQVIINLLSNAQDAVLDHPKPISDSSVGAITVAMTEEEGLVRIKVSDTGCGIPPDALGRIFDPFFTTKEVGKGTGLGLSVSYGIIASMGGNIDVFSTGGGAEFTVLLPTQVAQAREKGGATQQRRRKKGRSTGA